jgi:hypothetical protein
MPERLDPMTERLSRFTPNAAGLDRDAILFAAGRQSARTKWFWPTIAGLLAVSQAITFVALWPRSLETMPPEALPAASTSPELTLPPASPPPDVWTAGSRPDVLQKESSPMNGEYVPPGPALSVASGLRFD